MSRKSLTSDAESTSLPTETEGNRAVTPNNDVNAEPQENTTSDPADPFEPKDVDEEGLLKEYDVAICGTGLVQSILASALARAGKSVLHCDGADHYGELDTVWTLPMLEELVKNKDNEMHANSNNCDDRQACADTDDIIPLTPEGGRSSLKWHHSYCSSSSRSTLENTNFGIRVGTNVLTPFGDGVVRSISMQDQLETSPPSSQIAIQIELNKWKLADGVSPCVYVNCDAAEIAEIEQKGQSSHKSEDCTIDPVVLEDVLWRTKNIRSTQSLQAETILKQSARSLALDATPSFVLAAGRAVQGMLASGVADYLEFKTVDGLYWLEKAKSSSSKTRKKDPKSEVGSEGNDSGENLTLSRVPCSKNDVFGTKLLAPMEKRRFMKFIQLSMDYATKMSVAEEIRQENNDGGEKEEDIEIESQEEVHSLNERHLNQGRSLARPQNKAVDTDELQMLQDAIQNESMTFDEFLSQKCKLSPKLRSIVRYALAWEIGDSSTTLAKGMTTLRKHLQALGRYGTTAFLVPLYGSGELSQAFCRSAAVFGATYLLRRAPLAVRIDRIGGDNNKKELVKGIDLSSDVFSDEYTNKGKQQQPKTKSIACSHVIVPVNALGNNFFPQNGHTEKGTKSRVIRRISLFSGKLIQSDNEEQRYVIFIPPKTIGNDHAIHGVLLDSSACVAPRGCTILHLTTTILEESDINAAEMLERAQAAVLASKQASMKDEERPTEVYHASFSHAHRDTALAKELCSPRGLHLCSHTAQVLTADAAFEQAESIFHSICPGEKFLGLSSEIDKAIRERAEEKRYDDEEKNMLESAVDMIEQSDNSTS